MSTCGWVEHGQTWAGKEWPITTLAGRMIDTCHSAVTFTGRYYLTGLHLEKFSKEDMHNYGVKGTMKNLW